MHLTFSIKKEERIFQTILNISNLFYYRSDLHNAYFVYFIDFVYFIYFIFFVWEAQSYRLNRRPFGKVIRLADVLQMLRKTICSVEALHSKDREGSLDQPLPGGCWVRKVCGTIVEHCIRLYINTKYTKYIKYTKYTKYELWKIDI